MSLLLTRFEDKSTGHPHCFETHWAVVYHDTSFLHFLNCLADVATGTALQPSASVNCKAYDYYRSVISLTLTFSVI